jgi:succinate-semialdehyde dehydrogenase/glutarate-semialdehyde dehydrogenase
MYPDLVKLYIGGEWRAAIAGETWPIVNPANGEMIGRLACAGTADLDLALAASAAGFAK